MGMNFEWDEVKNRLNLERHGVSFEVAQEAFFDRYRVIVPDEKHSQNEKRFFCFGYDGNDVLTVRFTPRNGGVRIYGAGYWRKGKRIYAEKNHLH
ncbi:hypothetical protein FACS1894139_14760 [Planctomycetales bacterium]|nr:hypothetical protein FACS1894108_14460 [Planctomycetales bacterium]GHT07151.1 hypothetical protein FACS1894139_14760 [Planctomycetales bacterium]